MLAAKPEDGSLGDVASVAGCTFSSWQEDTIPDSRITKMNRITLMYFFIFVLFKYYTTSLVTYANANAKGMHSHTLILCRTSYVVLCNAPSLLRKLRST